MGEVVAHLKRCLPVATLDSIRRIRKYVSAASSAKPRPDNRPMREAEELLVLASAGESIESLRASIPITAMGKEVLGDLFGQQFASRFAEDRKKVLIEFDKLISANAHTDPKIEVRRARIAEINRRVHAEQESRRRGTYEPRKKAVRNADDWDI